MHDESNENSLMHDRICMADADPDAWPGMQDWTFSPRGGSQSYLYADLPMQGWWVVDSGSLDFPCVSVKNMENWRALT
jgi:hypothetical protein